MTVKLLIYADSRGQHTPRGEVPYEIFTTKLANHPAVDAQVFLCPMKWTTTVDFLDMLEKYPPEAFDHVLLHTGIVEWSPRPQVSAINDLYNNPKPVNLDNLSLNTREYGRKVINNKKPSFDNIFTEDAMLAHLATDFGVEYEGHPTVNMYSLEMAEQSLLPRLAEIENLIFINSNRFVRGWEGDFARGRPKNIALTEKYSSLFRDFLGPERVIDLLEWSDVDIKRYTCDNIHFTRAGSEFLYEKIAQRMKLDVTSVVGSRLNRPEIEASHEIAKPFAPLGRPLLTPSPLSPEDCRCKLEEVGLGPEEKLATLIIGVRFPDTDPSRSNNLRFLLDWIDHFYRDLFDVILIEQDSVSQIDRLGPVKPYVRHEFLYNPKAYNRGWAYNVAVKHFTSSSVVVLMDTDVLTGGNFIDEVIACHKQYTAVSPYANVYYTNADEALTIQDHFSFDGLCRSTAVKKPTTISGGVLIVQRSAYLRLLGYEQYTSYGGEDRAFDVVLLARCAADELRIAESLYIHLFHPSAAIDKGKIGGVLGHLLENYGCVVDLSLKAADDIHKKCVHASPARIECNLARRASSFGDPHLYSSGRELTVNGAYADDPATAKKSIIFPPDFTSLSKYPAKEIYEAPEPDSAEIAHLYNAFRGKRCFIIGNGPSLNKHDLSLLQDEYVFAVNSVFYKTDEMGFRPTFYVVEDTSVMKENIERIRAYDAPYKFFPTNYRTLHPKASNVYFFRMNRGFYEKSSPNFCVPRFSTDASKVVYCGQSVTYINLQLAYFLGFTEVYLIGMDFDYVIPKEHKRNGDVILSTTDDPNHFHKDYFGKGKTWKDPKLDRVAMNYRKAKLVYEAVGRRIYNATIGGKLEIFERADYESLLHKKPVAPKPKIELRHAIAAPNASTADNPLISVIVPAYNVEKYIAECLDSLGAQDDGNFEVIIVDDGSTDRTPKIIDEYCTRFRNFMSIRHKNSGLGAARNAGVEVCNGDFIIFVDSDDYVSPKAISTLRAEQERGDFDVVTGRFARISEAGEIEDVRTDALPQHKIPEGCPSLSGAEKVLGVFAPSVACARLYRKKLIEKNNLRFPARAPHEDLYFTYKIIAFSKAAGSIESVVYFYRQRSGSISKAVSKAHVDAIFSQWHDADVFLASVGGRPITRALAARRTFFMIEGIRKRVEDASENVKKYFEGELDRRRVGLQAQLADFRQSKIADSYVPYGAIRLIEGLEAKKRLVQPFEQTNVMFPHHNIDFVGYSAREVADVSEDDRRALAKLHNAYKGKRCFIIGNGPSLNKHNLLLLKNEYTFAVNSFFYKTKETGFRPTFYVVEDNLVMRENIDEIKAYDVPFKLFPANYKNLHPAERNVLFFPANWGFYLQSSPNYCVPRFSTDATRELFCGQTVTYINMQLAFFMGFTEVYLIGMDFNYVVPKEHGRKGNWILSTTDDPNHFHKDYFGKGKTWKDPKLDRVANSYLQAKLAYEAVGRKIYNATIGGRLEIFERVEYQSLFRRARNPFFARAARNVPVANIAPVPRRPFYAPFGEWLMKRFPRAYVGARFIRRAIAGLWRRRSWTVPALAFIVALAVLGFVSALSPWRGLLWGASAFATLAFGLLYVALRFYQFASVMLAGNAALSRQIRDIRRQVAAVKKDLAARESVIRGDMQAQIESLSAKAHALSSEFAKSREELATTADALRDELAEDREDLGRVRKKVEAEIKKTGAMKQELSTEKSGLARLRERIMTSERQIGAMRYPDAPSTLVFFGHHKCASRFFRNEVFAIATEATGARVRKYEIKNPPFHYSRNDDLDLCNMDFKDLGKIGRDVVVFSNATARSLNRIQRAAKTWKGIRVIRDPRQVLVSSYFHHKGNHHTELNGWIWDQLVVDKPILRELPVEQGLLYELDHITKQVIETQILCPFDDERVMTIKIEDFSKNPKTYLRQISEFLGVADIAGIDFNRTSSNPESGPWQQHFTSHIRDIFKERYGQALIDLGYAEDLDW